MPSLQSSLPRSGISQFLRYFSGQEYLPLFDFYFKSYLKYPCLPDFFKNCQIKKTKKKRREENREGEEEREARRRQKAWEEKGWGAESVPHVVSKLSPLRLLGGSENTP